MAELQSLAAAGLAPAPLHSKATVHAIDSVRCALCGAPLTAKGLRYRVVSPYEADARLTVCHTCHKVARGEGYRPGA